MGDSKKPTPAAIQPDAPDLPQVRIADCSCILPADAKPVGYRFRATEFSDVRVLVFGCPAHTHLGAIVPESDLPQTKKPKPKPAAKSK